MAVSLVYSFPLGPECSRNFTSNSGVIKSPGFPEKYPNNLDCTFMIFAPKMSEIILEFESFELESDPTPPAGVFCRYDRLEIWDGFPGGEQETERELVEASRFGESDKLEEKQRKGGINEPRNLRH